MERHGSRVIECYTLNNHHAASCYAPHRDILSRVIHRSKRLRHRAISLSSSRGTTRIFTLHPSPFNRLVDFDPRDEELWFPSPEERKKKKIPTVNNSPRRLAFGVIYLFIYHERLTYLLLAYRKITIPLRGGEGCRWLRWWILCECDSTFFTTLNCNSTREAVH